MKIVILGAKGMLGSDLGRVFYDWRPYLLDLDTLDITNEKAIWDLFHNLKPELVINAAAYTDVDGCETSRSEAMSVNGEAPRYLANASKDVGAIFVHYSTDYVFSGNKQDGYKEEDEPGDPINFYGESKLKGENAVRDVGGNYYLIRTSWLFGLGPSFAKASEGGPKNFVETIIRKVREVGGLTPQAGSDPEQLKIKVVNDQQGKPTFTFDLARRTRELIEDKHGFGIYHITNEPATTWYEFAKEIARQWGLTPRRGSDPEQLEPRKKTRFKTSFKPSFPRITPCSSDEFIRPAKRPEHSILLNTKLPPSRSWHEALQEYLLARGKGKRDQTGLVP